MNVFEGGASRHWPAIPDPLVGTNLPAHRSGRRGVLQFFQQATEHRLFLLDLFAEGRVMVRSMNLDPRVAESRFYQAPQQSKLVSAERQICVRHGTAPNWEGRLDSLKDCTLATFRRKMRQLRANWAAAVLAVAFDGAKMAAVNYPFASRLLAREVPLHLSA